MRKALLATDRKFWLDDRGSRMRIAALCRFLMGRGFPLEVFFIGELDQTDSERIASDYPGLRIHNGLSHQAQPVGASLLQRAVAWLRAVPKALRRSVRVLRSALLRLVAGPRKVPKAVKRVFKFCLPDGAFLRIQKLRRGRKPRRRARPSPRPQLRGAAHHDLKSFHSEDARQAFQAVCRQLRPDVVIVEYIRLGYLIDGLAGVADPLPLTIVDTLDVMSLRFKRFKEMGEGHWIAITEKEERQTLDLFDIVMAIQSCDAAQFRKMLPGKRVVTAMHAVALKPVEPVARAPVALLHLAANSIPNQRAISEFLRDVWPALHRMFGQGACLNVAGGICGHIDPSVSLDGVNVVGPVPDVEAVYREADIIVNPVLFGGGLKIKNVEALAHAMPLVTTTIGAEGMENGMGEAFLVCDSAEESIACLARLIENPERRRALSEKAYGYAAEHFTQERAYAELFQVLTENAN